LKPAIDALLANTSLTLSRADPAEFAFAV